MSVKIKNFNQQYEFAKKSIIQSIDAGQNIVLWGEGYNGKSHLVKELSELINESDYQILPEPCGFEDENYVSEKLKYLKKDKWVITTNNIDVIKNTLKNDVYVFINMNTFKYPNPKRLRLRSGRM